MEKHLEKLLNDELLKLDTTLGYFNTPFELGGLTFDNILNHFDENLTKNFGHQLVYILEKLERDKYIFKMENNTYHITSEGKIFWLKGGYLNSYQQDKFLFERQENDRMMSIRNEKILSVGSVGAMIGAIGVLIWEIGKTLYHFLCDY